MASEHCGYVVQLKELQPHPNADRLQIAVIFGMSVIVDLKAKIGDIGIFFPTDLQLSIEYCEQNNLVRKKDENGNNVGGYLEPDKRNIRAMKLRGAKSEGLFMPIESLKYTGETKFEVGQKIDIVGGHEICCKYIPRSNRSAAAGKMGNKARKKKVPLAPLFAEHADTEQLAYNLNAFKPGDLVEITLKMHGTSGRTGYLPKLIGYKRSLLDKIFRREGKPLYDWGYVTGTRRVVLEDFEGGFYGDNSFRKVAADFFEGKLNKGETVYYELVGFTSNGTPIMPEVNNNKISDKEFRKKYGETTVFSYGCDPRGTEKEMPEDEAIAEDLKYGDLTWDEAKDMGLLTKPRTDFYVYRMTLTTEEGFVVEYSPDFMRYRCEQMGAKSVPVLWRGYLDELDDWCGKDFDVGEYIKSIAERYYDGPDPVGKTHIREGVVVRIVNKPKFCAYKHKNFLFKCLSGIAIDMAVENNTINIMDEDRISEL